MANYAKRDLRAIWSRSLSDGAEERRREAEARVLRCHCGEKATLAFTNVRGESWFFCPAHEHEAQEMADKSARR